MTGRDDFGDRDWEGPIICDGRHRRLAKAGSPATARGCGELWRALLAAAVAVVVDFHWMGVFCRKVEARRMELEARY